MDNILIVVSKMAIPLYLNRIGGNLSNWVELAQITDHNSDFYNYDPNIK